MRSKSKQAEKFKRRVRKLNKDTEKAKFKAKLAKKAEALIRKLTREDGKLSLHELFKEIEKWAIAEVQKKPRNRSIYRKAMSEWINEFIELNKEGK